MKLLLIGDQESPFLWEHYKPGVLSDYDLILSTGDLSSKYLTFLVTMAPAPLLYVHGNHDNSYHKYQPEGCDCIEDRLVIYKGLRILGLGGSQLYNGKPYQYTEQQMRRRIRRLKRKIQKAGGIDIILTHAPAAGYGDASDFAHQGFECFTELIDQYHPKYFIHSHVHLNYGYNIPRIMQRGNTIIINAYERFDLDLSEQNE